MKKTLLYCSALLLGSLAMPNALHAQQYINGTFSTGAQSLSGVAAPTGATWSEASNDTGVTTISNTNAGYTASIASGISLADDYIVPAGQTRTVSNISFFSYQSGYTGTTSPFTALYVRIWQGSPAVAGSTIVFGDLTTNRLATATSTATYRIFNSLYPSPSAPGTTRLIWKVRANISPALTLAAGTYWIEWASTVSGTLAHFYVPVTVAGTRQTPGANALAYNAGWGAVIDDGNPAASPDVTVDFPFIVNDATVTATASANNGPALRVGPVPTPENLQVEFTEPRGASSLTLSDMMGRQVWAGTSAARSSSTSIPMADLATGVYMLSISSAEGNNRIRVVKE
jgi:hypothetical protein